MSKMMVFICEKCGRTVTLPPGARIMCPHCKSGRLTFSVLKANDQADTTPPGQHIWQGEKSRVLHVDRANNFSVTATGGYLSGSDENGKGFTIWIEDGEVYDRLQAALDALYPQDVCPECGIKHHICPKCFKRRVRCDPSDNNEPFATCDECDIKLNGPYEPHEISKRARDKAKAEKKRKQDAIKYAKALVANTWESWAVWRGPRGWVCVPAIQTAALDNQEAIIVIKSLEVCCSRDRKERRDLAAEIRTSRAAVIYGIAKHKKRGNKALFDYFAWLKRNGHCYEKLPG